MGLFNMLSQQNSIKDSILPVAAKNEILNGRLPRLNTDSIFLKSGEYCVYIDKAILTIDKTKKIYHHTGSSYKGLLGNPVRYGTGHSHEYKEPYQYKGILYITNKRVIFQAKENAFEKMHTKLTSIEPYSNAVILQYGDKTYQLIVADGNVVNRALHLLN